MRIRHVAVGRKGSIGLGLASGLCHLHHYEDDVGRDKIVERRGFNKVLGTEGLCPMVLVYVAIPRSAGTQPA